MAAMDVLAQGMPFKDAIDYFQQKVNLPTERWADIWQGMHSRAFVVAGATKAELLTDFRQSIDKAIAEGTTIAEFRRDFDAIVARHGWKYKGGRNWRTSVIFNTNCRVAYQAGHYQQMTDPYVLERRPWWRYVAVKDGRTRPQHREWHNTVLKHDDPWWGTHYPPNGWGCRCDVVSQSEKELERLKAQGEQLQYEAPEIEYRDWTDKATGETHRVPMGIDPGWDYNVGETAWGRRLSGDVMDSWRAQGGKAFERLTAGDWRSYGRPSRIAVDSIAESPGPLLGSTEEVRQSIQSTLGAVEKVFTVDAGGFELPVLVNAESLAAHVPLDRSSFIPMLPDLLSDPFEVWLSFERHLGTGKVELRTRIIKGIDLGTDKAMILVAQARNGFLEAWTFLPTGKWNYVQGQRVGQLIFGR